MLWYLTFALIPYVGGRGLPIVVNVIETVDPWIRARIPF